MTRGDFTRLYPDLQKRTQFIREVVVSGAIYSYSFSVTADRRLEEQIKTLQATGQDPLKFIFEQKFDNSKSPMEKYSISIVGEAESTPAATVSKAQPVKKDFSGVQMPKNKEQPTETQKPKGVTSDEHEVLKAIHSSNPDKKIPYERFKKIFMANNDAMFAGKLSEDRIKFLYDKVYNILSSSGMT